MYLKLSYHEEQSNFDTIKAILLIVQVILNPKNVYVQLKKGFKNRDKNDINVL